MVAVVVLSIIDIDSQILVMASLLTSPGTLRTQAVADPGEQKTIKNGNPPCPNAGKTRISG